MQRDAAQPPTRAAARPYSAPLPAPPLSPIGGGTAVRPPHWRRRADDVAALEPAPPQRPLSAAPVPTAPRLPGTGRSPRCPPPSPATGKGGRLS